jgi:drug/metabolite transporter (DMT)-like permease
MSSAIGSHRTTLVVCFAIVYLVWGSSYLATAIGVRNLPPFLFGGIRFAIAGVLLTVLAKLLGRTLVINRAELRHLFVVALGSVLLSNGLNVWAMQWVASNQAALLNATAALWIAILATRGRRAHALDSRTTTGLVVGFVGVALILWPRGNLSANYLPQQAAILVGVFAWSYATVYMRNVVTQLNVLSFTGLQMLLGGIMLITVGLATGETSRWNLSPTGLWSMAYLTIMSSCVTYVAYAWLTRNTTPSAVGTYSYVNPAIAAVLGRAYLDEVLSTTQLLGMAVMLAGVALVSWPRPRTASKPVT